MQTDGAMSIAIFVIDAFFQAFEPPYLADGEMRRGERGWRVGRNLSQHLPGPGAPRRLESAHGFLDRLAAENEVDIGPPGGEIAGAGRAGKTARRLARIMSFAKCRDKGRNVFSPDRCVGKARMN